MSDKELLIEIIPLQPDAPENIQWIFGYRVKWMGCWRIVVAIEKHEVIPKLLRRIGAE